MYFHFPKSKNDIRNYFNDPLLKNSLFLMVSSVSNTFFGFLFWMIAAKYYTPFDVGIATALLSSMGLLVLISRVGLDFSLIRFFPNNDKSKIFNTCAIITSVCVIIFGVVYIIGIDIFSPELFFLKTPLRGLIFVIYLLANSITTLASTSFVAIRKAEFQFVQSILVGTRIIFLFPFIALGAIGIFDSVGISFIIALLIAVIMLVRYDIVPKLTIDRIFLADSFHFSVGNYIAGLFITAPNFILPIMVLNILGAESAAYYYIVSAITGLLFMIPNSISMSLFVEGSHGESLRKTVIKSVVVIFLFLIPSSIILYVFSAFILGLVGADYALGGIELFKVMILGSVFVSLNYIYNSIQRVQGDIKGIVFISGFVFCMLIGFSYLFMGSNGLIGVGYAWILSYFFGTIIFISTIWKYRLI